MMEKFKAARGFTLIEVVVAITVISALVASFAPLIGTSIKNIKWAGLRTENLYAQRGQLEEKLATLSGTNVTVEVWGPTEAGHRDKWEVGGRLVIVRELNAEQKLNCFFVSFVVPKE
jgi:prepilin-type N-terminal cleavage/methylation domain-containing protein